MVNAADTIVYNSAKIAEYQSNKKFDYSSYTVETDYGLWENIKNWLAKMLNYFFESDTATEIAGWLLIAILVTMVLLVIYFIYKKRPELFSKEKRAPHTYQVEKENIYTIDFEKEINMALNINDFRTAIRILYLQTIRFIADKNWIEWQIYKTATDYVYELKHTNIKTPFSDFTTKFLQVRYGNFIATREEFDKMCFLQEEIKKT